MAMLGRGISLMMMHKMSRTVELVRARTVLHGIVFWKIV